MSGSVLDDLRDALVNGDGGVRTAFAEALLPIIAPMVDAGRRAENGNPEILKIITTQLVVEEAMNEAFEAVFVMKRLSSNERGALRQLGVATKLALVRASRSMFQSPETEWLFKTTKALNQLRNAVAHGDDFAGRLTALKSCAAERHSEPSEGFYGLLAGELVVQWRHLASLAKRAKPPE